MKPMKLSPPQIAEPVHALGRAVVVSGHLAGADIKVFRYQSGSGKLEEIGNGTAPWVDLFNIRVQQFATGDKVFAVQQYQVGSQTLKSADPPPKLLTAVFPQVPLPAPYVNAPLYVCARMISVGNIVNGAMVEVYRNRRRIVEAPIGYPNLGIRVDPPLKARDEVYAVQYFPDIKPATSDVEKVVPYPERKLPKPTIRKPLIECAPSFQVEGLVPGATVFVHEKKSGDLVAERVVSELVESVEVEGGLRKDWTLTASQQLCGENDRSPDSDPVKVEEIGCFPTYPPKLAAPIKPGNMFVVVDGVHESTIRILADGKDIGGGTCFGTTVFGLDAPLPNARIQLVQSLDCRRKVWEVKSHPVRSVPDDELLELDESTFLSTISTAARPVMIDYWAAWCPICVKILPKIKQLAKDYAGKVIIAKLDTKKYNPYSDTTLPMFRFYKSGKVVATVKGWHESKIRNELNKLAGP